MSNPANYSPYNKTYKFILFQNQAYHQRNKRNISPCVRTNLRHSLSRSAVPRNTDKIDLLASSPTASQFSDYKTHRSGLFEKHRQIDCAHLSEPKRVVHKNETFEKFRKQQITNQNAEMVSRILQSNCQVLKNNVADKSFRNHLRYQNIRRHYYQGGHRKDYLPLGKSDLLCPTLHEFNTSGLGGHFVQMDLSMSVKPATSHSIRRSCHSNIPV